MHERFLNTREAAALLRIPEEELHSLVKEGKIPAYRIAGEFLRFDRSQIESYLHTVRLARSQSQELRYSPRERLFDFFFYNDFYIVAVALVVFLLVVIFRQ